MPRKVPQVNQIRNKTPTSKELEKALEVMQSLGFKVTPPSSAEESEKQESSAEKLGFSEAKKRKVKVQPDPQFLDCYLGTAHHIAGNTYGPGKVSIPFKQVSLYRTLIHQDNLAKQSYLDTRDYNPFSKCFIITQSPLREVGGSYGKLEVTEAQFNSAAVLNHVTVTAGAVDIAGYPGLEFNENRSF